MIGKWVILLGVHLLVLGYGQSRIWAEKFQGNDQPRVTRYRYEALPLDGEQKSKELIEMEWTPSDSGLAYSSRGVSADSVEAIRIQTDTRGRFISGMRSLTRRATGQVSQEKIWRENHKVYFQRGPEKNEITKQFELAQDQVLAVDGSLLLMLRFFPFDEQKEWKVFMVDFSGHSATVTVRQVARERIAVPAGDFECYRMEAVVNIPVLRPKVTYWISTTDPHFMVKHQGKRGPFTPSYTTSLISFE